MPCDSGSRQVRLPTRMPHTSRPCRTGGASRDALTCGHARRRHAYNLPLACGPNHPGAAARQELAGCSVVSCPATGIRASSDSCAGQTRCRRLLRLGQTRSVIPSRRAATPSCVARDQFDTRCRAREGTRRDCAFRSKLHACTGISPFFRATTGLVSRAGRPANNQPASDVEPTAPHVRPRPAGLRLPAAVLTTTVGFRDASVLDAAAHKTVESEECEWTRQPGAKLPTATSAGAERHARVPRTARESTRPSVNARLGTSPTFADWKNGAILWPWRGRRGRFRVPNGCSADLPR